MYDKIHTIQSIRPQIKAVLKDHGADTVYVSDPELKGTCSYVHSDGSVGCLVGQWMAKEGIPLPAFRDPTNQCGIAEDEMGTWLRKHGHVLTRDARTWLTALQNRQDMGDPWGEAMAQADEIVGTEDEHDYLA